MHPIARPLETAGYAVVPDFLDASLVARAREEIGRERAAFARAGIGKAEKHATRDDVRRDETRWWEFSSLTPVQREIWNRIEALKQELNRELYLGLWEVEGHYAVYPPGAFYRRHLDRFSNDDRRKVSIVLFFNADWDSARDGGCLRLECSDGTAIEVAPLGGTLVCFMSDRIPHEVMETRRERLSFAGWWKTR